MVGSHDPLYDNCWRFTEQLARAEVDVHLKIYDKMMHGFLSFDIDMIGISETR
jgi:acetyl esterase/lipase